MLPFFYHSESLKIGSSVQLSAEASKHCVAVLRMQEGSPLQLTDGNGMLADAKILVADKRECVVLIVGVVLQERAHTSFGIAVGFTKSRSRNEWLLEKATEMGVAYILPLDCAHSDYVKLSEERAQGILVSAMLQSQQCYLPVLAEISAPTAVANNYLEQGYHCLVAHCEEQQPRQPLLQQLQSATNTLLFIGPEGDFSSTEISILIGLGVEPVSLGKTRLRTETAAVYGCAVINAFQNA